MQNGPILALKVVMDVRRPELRSALPARPGVPGVPNLYRTPIGCLGHTHDVRCALLCLLGPCMGRIVRSHSQRFWVIGGGCSQLSQGRATCHELPDSAGPGTACTLLWDPPIRSLEKHHVPLCHAASQSAQDDVVRMLHAGPSPRSSALQAAGCGRGTAGIRVISRGSSRLEASSVVCWCRQAPC